MQLNESELGNTWLTFDDQQVIWINLPDNQRLCISITPDNYPGLRVRTVSISDEDLANHIIDHLGGWTVRKCNVAGVRVVNGKVDGAE